MITDPKELLDTYHANTLWEMARAAKLPGTTGNKLRKASLLQLMQREFFQPERIKAAYQHLSPQEKEVVNRLLLRGGQTPTRLLQRELVRAELATAAPASAESKKQGHWLYSQPTIYGRLVSHIGRADNPESTIFEDVLARLTLHGLVFTGSRMETTTGTGYKLQLHPGETVFIPPFVSRHLPSPEPLPVSAEAWQPDHLLHGDPQLLLRDLYLYWDTVRRSEIALIQSGFVGKRGLKQLNDALLTTDPSLENARQEDQTDRLYLLRQLLEILQLVKTEDKRLQTTTGGRTIPDFWQKSTAAQVTAVIAAWRTLPQPVRFPADDKYYQYTFQTRQACQNLLGALAEMPAATWIEREDLMIRLQERHVDFLIAMRSRIEGGRGYYYYGNREKIVAEIDKLERQFVGQVMAQFLFQSGIVELGFAKPPTTPDAWQAFRLTPLGTGVLHNPPRTIAGPDGQIVIQPNFQILAIGPVSLHLLAQLDLFAERQKVDRTAFAYLLSRESVYAAQQIGYAVSEVQGFLQEASANDLPQNIRRSLAEWAAYHERIVLRRNVTLLQAADAALLERLFDDPATGPWLARKVGSAVALVKNRQHENLVGGLRNVGILPAISGANPEAADGSVIINQEGRIRPIHAVPSLHLRGRLSRFAAETTDGGWQLTEESVRRAGGSKKKAQAIIDELGKLNRGRLPQKLVEQIRAWGGYFGQATVATMTLVEFRDQETLEELRQVPALKERLQPFPAGSRALAVVAAEEVTAVQETLAQLGVQIDLK